MRRQTEWGAMSKRGSKRHRKRMGEVLRHGTKGPVVPFPVPTSPAPYRGTIGGVPYDNREFLRVWGERMMEAWTRGES